MKKIELYRLKGLYREDFVVEGYRFGGEENSACIVGALRGNEMQQLYICSQLIKVLKELEAHGAITHGHGILVVPTANSYSMNVGKRFWAVDNIDINRTFPGDLRGDTTKQIAGELFEKVKGYSYGIQFASFYLQGISIPHVRMMETGTESTSLANLFGMPYVLTGDTRSFDTATLNYNWQKTGTQAFSVYSATTDTLDGESAKMAVSAVLRFLTRMGIIRYESHGGYISTTLKEKDLVSVRADEAGFFRCIVGVNQEVKRGQVLAEIINPMDGNIKAEVLAPTDGIVFFVQNSPLVFQNVVIYKIVRRMHQ